MQRRKGTLRKLETEGLQEPIGYGCLVGDKHVTVVNGTNTLPVSATNLGIDLHIDQSDQSIYKNKYSTFL